MMMMVVEEKAEVGRLQEMERRLACAGQPPTKMHSSINGWRGLVPRGDVCPIRHSRNRHAARGNAMVKAKQA